VADVPPAAVDAFTLAVMVAVGFVPRPVVEQAPTYNLEVDGYHVFFADGVLVHNAKQNDSDMADPITNPSTNSPPNTPDAPSGCTNLTAAPACLLSGTQVTLANGSTTPIQLVKVGDEVAAYRDGIVVNGTVTEVFRHPAMEMEEYYVKINDRLRVTPNHFMYVNDGWLPAGEIVVGDMLLSLDGSVVNVSSVENVYEMAPTYNLEVDGCHTFYADDFLVHNAKSGYHYWASTTDPNGDSIYYKFSWGNGEDSGWLGPLDSGDTCHTTYAWSNPGTYDVTVRAKDEHGELSGWSDPLTVYVNEAPVADFIWAPDTPATNDVISFDASSSSDSDGSITTYRWDWDNNGVYEVSTSSPTTSHSWDNYGTYKVTLEVTDDDGRATSVSKDIFVKDVRVITVAILQGVMFVKAADQIKEDLHLGNWNTDICEYSFSVDIVTAGDICGFNGGILRDASEATNNYDLFIIPGIGQPYLFCAPNFDVTRWRNNIRAFVSNGGGYLGICGGAVAASSGLTGGDDVTTPMEVMIEKSTLGLIDAKAIQDFAHPMTASWANKPESVGQTAYLVYNLSDQDYPTNALGVSVDLHSIDTSHPFFNGYLDPQVAIRWYGGPGFVLDGDADILARYPIQEISENADTRFHVWRYDNPLPATAPMGAINNYSNPTDADLDEYADWLEDNMDFPYLVDYDKISGEYIDTYVSDSGAIVADTFGDGSVIVFGPHPEDWTWTNGYIQDNNDTDSNTLIKGLYHWGGNYVKQDEPEWMIIRGAAWAIGLDDSELPPIP